MKEKQIDKQLWCCYDQLAAAIVEGAIEDWRLLIKQGTKVENWWKLIEQGENIEDKKYKRVSFNEIRAFFMSEHCKILMQGMKIKPQTILILLESEKREAGL